MRGWTSLSVLGLTKSEVERQSARARFFVFSAHIAPRLGHGGDRRVEIDPVPGRDLIGRNHKGNPGFHRAEGASFDAGHLDVPRDRVAGHPQMMLERRFGRVLKHQRRTVMNLSQERGRHGGGDADLGLTSTFGP